MMQPPAPPHTQPEQISHLSNIFTLSPELLLSANCGSSVTTAFRITLTYSSVYNASLRRKGSSFVMHQAENLSMQKKSVP